MARLEYEKEARSYADNKRATRELTPFDKTTMTIAMH